MKCNGTREELPWKYYPDSAALHPGYACSTIMKSEASAALEVYLGANQTGGYLPMGQSERMSAAYGDDAKAKLELIQKYLEFDHPSSDWSRPDLAQEQKAVEALLAQRFPELDRVAVNALACRWSYSWK